MFLRGRIPNVHYGTVLSGCWIVSSAVLVGLFLIVWVYFQLMPDSGILVGIPLILEAKLGFL